ncbi:unnamed protein product [Lampetra fluviatilis]
MDTRRTARVRVPEGEDTVAVGEPGTAEENTEQSGSDASTPQQQENGEPSTEGLRQAHAKLAELLYAAAAMLDQITQLGLLDRHGVTAAGDHSTFPPFRRSTTLKIPPSPQLLLRAWPG